MNNEGLIGTFSTQAEQKPLVDLSEIVEQMQKIPPYQKGIPEVAALAIHCNGLKLMLSPYMQDDDVIVLCGKKAFERMKTEFKK